MVYLKAWGSLSALESPLLIPALASINSAFRKEILKIEQKVINVRVLKVMDAAIVPSGERNNLSVGWRVALKGFSWPLLGETAGEVAGALMANLRKWGSG